MTGWRKVKVVVNPNAGRKRRRARELALIGGFFSDHSTQHSIEITKGKGDGLMRARQAVAEGCDLAVAVGGDGTVNEVASALVGTDTALGIIPTGSGNGLARALGIPLIIDKACGLLIEGKILRIDAGQLEGRYFFSAAGVGFDALVGRKFNESYGSQRGMLPYFHIVARELFKYKPEKIELRFNRREITVYPLLVTISNTGHYGGGAIIAPQARPHDGLFEVCIVHKLNPFQALFYARKLFTGQIASIPKMEIYQTDSLQITTTDACPVHVDGEPFQGNAQLRIKLWPQALQILAPAF